MPRIQLRVGFALLALFLRAMPASADSVKWPQPDGPGTDVLLTYSFSNLLDGGFNTTLSRTDLQEATIAAFSVWSRYAPLHFREVQDAGPWPSETDYSPGAAADIRIGYQSSLSDGTVAHAHVPQPGVSALAGDIHFSNDVSSFHASAWGAASAGPFVDFFSAILHEIGHALGLPHSADGSGIMGLTFLVFLTRDQGDLLPSDIAAIRALYGAGRGSVVPLDGPSVITPEPASVILMTTGLGILARRRFSRSRP